MPRSVRAVIMCAWIVCLAPVALAQDTVQVARGARVRLQLRQNEGWSIGRVAWLRGDSVALGHGGRALQVYSVENVRAMQVSAGRTGPGHAIAGLTVGAFAGGLAGYLYGRWEDAHTRSEAAFSGAGAPLGAIGGAVVGGLVGAFVGTALRSERWVPVRLIRGERH